MNHANDAPRSFTLLVDWRIPPRQGSSHFLCCPARSAADERRGIMPMMHRGHSPCWWTGEYRQCSEYPRLSAFICGRLLFPGYCPALSFITAACKCRIMCPGRMQPDTRKSTRRLAAQTRERCAQFRIGNIPGHGFQQLARTRGDGLCTLHDLLASTEGVWCGAHLKTNQLLEKRLGAQCPYQGFV